MAISNICEFGSKIKIKLVEINQTQDWLIDSVNKDTGLFFDKSYMYKILTGKLKTPKIIESISKILGL